jgi:hypothetical protein
VESSPNSLNLHFGHLDHPHTAYSKPLEAFVGLLDGQESSSRKWRAPQRLEICRQVSVCLGFKAGEDVSHTRRQSKAAWNQQPWSYWVILEQIKVAGTTKSPKPKP